MGVHIDQPLGKRKLSTVRWKWRKRGTKSWLDEQIEEAKGLTYCRKGYQFIVNRALNNKRLKQRGLTYSLDHYLKVHVEI